MPSYIIRACNLSRGQTAAISAYKMAGIKNPLEDLDLIELHDAYTSSELQTYEDLGL